MSNEYIVGKPIMASVAKENKESLAMMIGKQNKDRFKVVVDSNGFATLPDGSSVRADMLVFHD